METSVASVMDDSLNMTTRMGVDTFIEKVETLTTFKIATLMNTYWFPILIPIGLVWEYIILFGDDKREQQENVNLYLHG